MATFEFSDSVVIDASADVVYDMVSDVTRTGEWSPVCKECWWNDGDAGNVGSKFTGRNSTPERTWESVSEVVVAEPGREFAWTVNNSLVRWGYTLESLESDSMRLTESWHFLPAGIEFFHSKFGDDAQAEIDKRSQAALSGIPETLAAIKKIAETP